MFVYCATNRNNFNHNYIVVVGLGTAFRTTYYNHLYIHLTYTFHNAWTRPFLRISRGLSKKSNLLDFFIFNEKAARYRATSYRCRDAAHVTSSPIPLLFIDTFCLSYHI
jgi:hypothetical protein